MQGQSQRGGLRGGRRGFGGPSDRGGNRQDPSQLGSVQNRSTGPGGMTPGPGPGGMMVAGATPGPSGVAIGGTTAGFAGGPTPGGGGGQSLQDLFAAQQPPAQGIATLPTNEMTFSPLDSPSFTAFETFRNIPLDFIDFGFPPSEDNTSSFESGESVLDNLKNILDSIRNPKFDLGPGTLDINVDPFKQEGGINFTVPLGPQSSLVNPDTSGIMQMAELTEDQKNFMMSPKQSLDFQSKDSLFNKIKQLEDTGIFGIGGQEPTTREEFEDFISSPEYKSAFI